MESLLNANAQGGLAGGGSTFVLQAMKTEFPREPQGAKLPAERQTRSPREPSDSHFNVLPLENIYINDGKPGYLDATDNCLLLVARIKHLLECYRLQVSASLVCSNSLLMRMPSVEPSE